MAEANQSVKSMRMLRDAVAQRPTPTRFNGVPYYSPVGDFLTLFLASDDGFEDRIDDTLTIYRSEETDEIVGCKIKGVSLLASHVVNIINVDDGEFHLSLLLLNALGMNEEHRKHYYDLGKRVGDVTIPADLLGKMKEHLTASQTSCC